MKAKSLRDRRGSVAVIVALTAPLLIAAAALSLDIAVDRVRVSKLDTAAVLAAKAAGMASVTKQPVPLTLEALAAAQLNDCAPSDCTMRLTIPPTQGKHAGDRQFLEVRLSRPRVWPLWQGWLADDLVGYGVARAAYSPLTAEDVTLSPAPWWCPITPDTAPLGVFVFNGKCFPLQTLVCPWYELLQGYYACGDTGGQSQVLYGDPNFPGDGWPDTPRPGF